MQPNEFILSKKEHKRYLNALMRMPGTQLHKQLVLTRAMSAVIFVVIVALAFLVQLPGALQDPGRLQRLGSTTLVEIVLLAILAWFMPPWSLRRRQMRMEALNGIKGDRFKETSRVWVEDGFYIRQTGQAAANRLPLAGLQWARLGEGCGVVLQFENGMCDYVPNDVLSEILSEALVAVGGPKFDDADRELAKKFFDLYTPSEIEAALKRLSYNYENWEDYRTIPLVEEVGPYKKTSAYGFGSTDVGDASYAAPTAQMNVATYANGTPGHSWNVTAQVNSSITHKALVTVAEALSLACILTIERPEAVKAAREEYIKSTGGKYICPVGMDAKPELEHV